MLNDLSLFLDFLKSDEGENVRKRIFLFVIIFFILVFINRFVTIAHVSDSFKVIYNQSKFLFKNGISPYSTQSQSLLADLSIKEQWNISKNAFELENPIYLLILFWPFTLISNYQWAESLFITLNQLFVIVSVHMMLRMLKFETKAIETVFIYLLSLCSAFVLPSFFSANFSIIQFTFIIAALFFDDKGKYILSGFFFGMSIVDPINAFYIILCFVIIFISNRKVPSLLWASITVLLLTLFSFIFDRQWIIGWLKNLFLTPTRYPFITYREAFMNIYNFQINRIFTIVPVLLLIWVVFEVSRTNKNHINKVVWLISLAGILNHFLMVQNASYNEVFFLPSIVLLISIWSKRISNTTKTIIYGIGVVITILFIKFSLFNSRINPEMMLTIFGIVIILNLYWVRSWIVKPYSLSEG